MVEYTYDAWGNILSITGSMASTLGRQNPLRYRGYVYDQETGLYYLQSRYYDPEIGRFINADALVSTGQGLLGNNMFVYCNNNPISHKDATGNFPWLIVGLAVLFVGGVIYGATTDRNLREELTAQPANKPSIGVHPEQALDFEEVKEASPSFPTAGFSIRPKTEKISQNADNTLTTQDRIDNMIIGGGFALLIGGAVTFLGGATACVTGYTSTMIPVLGTTGSQTVAWGMLVHNAFAILIAPIIGMEVDVLEYPS